jgi:hypothetical protein
MLKSPSIASSVSRRSLAKLKGLLSLVKSAKLTSRSKYAPTFPLRLQPTQAMFISLTEVPCQWLVCQWTLVSSTYPKPMMSSLGSNLPNSFRSMIHSDVSTALLAIALYSSSELRRLSFFRSSALRGPPWRRSLELASGDLPSGESCAVTTATRLSRLYVIVEALCCLATKIKPCTKRKTYL